MTRCLATLLLLLTLAGPALAQVDLTQNGNFDTDISGWELNTVGGMSTAVWDSFDVAASPTSGSLLVTVDPADIGNNASGVQCLPVVGGTSYDFGTSIFVPTQPASQVFMRTQYFDDLQCGGNNLDTEDISAFVPFDSWRDTERLGVVIPAMSQSVKIFLVVFEDPLQVSSLSAYFDDVFFVPEPGALVSGLAALIALAALILIRRS